MLDHMQMPEQAERLRRALIRTLEAKDHLTRDLGGSAGTVEFTDALIRHLN